MSNSPEVNPYFAGTEQWFAYDSGVRDTLQRIALGHPCDPNVEERHLVEVGRAYIAGVRKAHTDHQKIKPC